MYNKLEDGQNGEDTAKWYPPKRRPETGGYVDVKMTAEMTADYIMIIWLVEMTSEMTAGSIELIRWSNISFYIPTPAQNRV